MALIILGKTECSICGIVIEDRKEIVSTTHFITDQNDPLGRFSDSAMHKSCFISWKQETFIKKYNETIGTAVWGNKTHHYMQADGRISVLKNN